MKIYDLVQWLQKSINRHVPRQDFPESCLTTMKGVHFPVVVFSLLALTSSFASASDPSPLQDFCIAINDPKDGGMSTLSLFSFELVFWNIFFMSMTKLKDSAQQRSNSSTQKILQSRENISLFFTSMVVTNIFLILQCLLMVSSARTLCLPKQKTSFFQDSTCLETHQIK